MNWHKYIPEDIAELYEVHDFKHAAAILSQEFPTEFEEVGGFHFYLTWCFVLTQTDLQRSSRSFDRLQSFTRFNSSFKHT